MSSDSLQSSLLMRSAAQLYALPLTHVEAIMRPLPVRRLAGVPPFVLGMTVIRGLAVPVIDAAAVAGSGVPSTAVTRFVALKLGDRRAALAVDTVLGIHALDHRQLSALPRLLTRAPEAVISAIGQLDDELLLVLRSARLVPDDVWTAVETGGAL